VIRIDIFFDGCGDDLHGDQSTNSQASSTKQARMTKASMTETTAPRRL
jgi:hypothetical protein